MKKLGVPRTSWLTPKVAGRPRAGFRLVELRELEGAPLLPKLLQGRTQVGFGERVCVI